MKPEQFSHYLKLIEQFPNQKILVIGDVMLDDYWIGDVNRISPEAPVPILSASEQRFVPGGAGNVGNNINALSGGVHLMGVIGTDAIGKTIGTVLREKNISYNLVEEQNRKTTHKIRVVTSQQQITRVDWESKGHIKPETAQELLDKINNYGGSYTVWIISDYGKGVFNKELCEKIFEIARSKNVFTIVDPIPKNTPHYEGCHLITPNHKEASKMLGVEDDNEDEEVNKMGIQLQKKLGSNILITRGDKGMSLYSTDDQLKHIPTKAREVFDVSGAGDTVVSVLALSIAAGASISEAADIANHAAGVVVGKIGTSTLSKEELIKSIEKDKKNQMNNLSL